jgi:uncharacterized protein YndB with AHSA1/START domain
MAEFEATVIASGERAIEVRRDFRAPRNLVYDTFMKPELLQRWMGVFGDWSWASCEVDARVGGRYRWEWTSREGGGLVLSGVFREVVPNERTVATQVYEGMDEYGEMLVTTIFTEHDGRTTVEQIVEYPTREARDIDIKQRPTGIGPGFAMLDELLASLG